MLEPADLIARLEFAKSEVDKLAWALSLLVAASDSVERTADNINGWIDAAIERIRVDAAFNSCGGIRADTRQP